LLRDPSLSTQKKCLSFFKAAGCLAISEIGIFADFRQGL